MIITKRIAFIISALLFFFAFSLPAQNRGNRSARPDGSQQQKAKIIGKIINADSGDALEFATFTLFSQRDSQLVTGGISDEKGMFSVETKSGNFIAKIEFISYRPYFIADITLTKDRRFLDLGTIQLSPDTKTLSEVEVRAEKSSMQMSLDKKIFNVGKDLASQGGNAADILDNVPSVTVDVEGSVELRGNANVRILVDGKPSGLLGADNANGLRALPGNMIDRIEVITNPSAKYEAEGMAGIINIVLRKEKQKGVNGSFDFTVGHPDQYGAAINMNYRKKNFNFFTNYGIRYRNRPGGGVRKQQFTVSPDSVFLSDQDRDFNRTGWSNSIRLGADYYFGKDNVLTTSFIYRFSKEENFNTTTYEDFFNSYDNPTTFTERTDDETEDEYDLEYALNYSKDFSRKGQKLTAEISYQDETETESSNFVEAVKEPAGLFPDILQQSKNEEANRRFILKSDYTHPVNDDSKLEMGFQSSLRTIKNDYIVEFWKEDKWNTDLNYTNNFIYDENIHGIYLNYTNKINKFSYQFGVRGEYTDVRTELVNTNSINDRSYFNVFPSVFFSYELPKDHAVQVSYSRRVTRPRFRYLNPFFTFSDPRNFFAGNPNLDPEFTDSYELSHIKYWEKASFTSAVYYKRTTDVIQRIQEVDTLLGYTQTLPQNLATKDDYGLEFTFSMEPLKNWKVNGNFNFYRSITDGEHEGQSYYADTYTWFARLMSRTTIGKNFDIQLTANYRAPRETVQGKTKGIAHLNLAMSKDVFNDNNGTLTLSVRDVFNSRKRRFITDLPDFYSEGDFQWRARQIILTLNYRLNQNKKKGREGGRGDFEGGDQF